MNSDLNNVFLWKATLDVKSGNMTEPIFAPIVSSPIIIPEPLSRIEELEMELINCKNSSGISKNVEKLMTELKTCNDLSSKLEDRNAVMANEIEQLNTNHTQKTKDLEEQLTQLRGIEAGIEKTQQDLQDCLSKNNDVSGIDSTKLSLEKQLEESRDQIEILTQQLVDENNSRIRKDASTADEQEQVVSENTERIRIEQECKDKIGKLEKTNTELLEQIEQCNLSKSQLQTSEDNFVDIQRELEIMGTKRADILQKLQELGIGENDIERHSELVQRIKYIKDVEAELSKRIGNTLDEDEREVLKYAKTILTNKSVEELKEWRGHVNNVSPVPESSPMEQDTPMTETGDIPGVSDMEDIQVEMNTEDQRDDTSSDDCTQVAFDYENWTANPSTEQTPVTMAAHMVERMRLTQPDGIPTNFTETRYVGEQGTVVSNKELMFKYGFISTIANGIMSHDNMIRELENMDTFPVEPINVRVYEGNGDPVGMRTRGTEYTLRIHEEIQLCKFDEQEDTQDNRIANIQLGQTNIGDMFTQVLEILSEDETVDTSGNGKLRLIFHLIKYLGIHVHTNTGEYITILSGNPPDISLGSSILSDMSSMFMWL